MSDIINTERAQEWERIRQEEAGQPATAPTDAPPANDADPAGDAKDGQAATDGPPAGSDAARPSEGETPGEPDPWANADPKLREAFQAERTAREQAEQAARTQGGRAAAEARRALELNTELKRLREERIAAGNGTESEKKLPVVDDETKQRIAEEYPDLGKPVLDLIAGLEARIVALDAAGASQAEKAAAAQELEDQRFLAEQEQRLAEQHPDWTAATAEPGFETWLLKQPAMVIEAAKRNGQGIVDADDAAMVIRLYKTERDGSDASKLANRRERQLEGTKLPVTTVPGAVTNQTSDRKAEWQRLAAEERQQQARR